VPFHYKAIRGSSVTADNVLEVQRCDVRRLASRGVPVEMIRHLIGGAPSGSLYTRPRFLRLFKDDLARGKAEADAAVAEALFELAHSGKSVQATLAWARQRLGWAVLSEGDDDRSSAASARKDLSDGRGQDPLATLQTLLDQIAAHKAASAGSSAELAATSATEPTAASG
jgi:hypothetical protein